MNLAGYIYSILFFLVQGVGYAISNDSRSYQDHLLFQDTDSLMRIGKYKDCILSLNESQNNFKSKKDWINYSISLVRAAECHRLSGDIQMARKKIQECINVTLQNESRKSINYINAIYELAMIQSSQLEYDSAIQNLNEAINICIKQYGTNHIKVAEGKDKLGTVHRRNRNIHEALQIHQSALEIKTIILDTTDVEFAKSYKYIGDIYRITGEHEKALEYYRKSEKLCLVQNKAYPILLSAVYANMGLSKRKLGQYKAATMLQKKSLHLLQEFSDKNSKAIALRYINLGNIFRSMSLFDSAMFFLKKAESLNPELSTLSSLYNYFGITFGSKGLSDSALYYFEKSAEINLKKLEDDHPLMASPYMNIGSMYLLGGSYDRALEYYQKSLSIRLKVYGPKSNKVAIVYGNIGALYTQKLNFDEALRWYTKALNIRTDLYQKPHPKLAQSYRTIGELYRRMHEYDSAMKYNNLGLELCEEVFGKKHLSVAKSNSQIGLIYSDINSHSKAIEYLVQALNIQKELLNSRSPVIAETSNYIASSYKDLRQFELSLTAVQQALKFNTITYNDSLIFSIPSLNGILDENILLESLRLKASILEELSKADRRIPLLKSSLQNIQLCDTLIEMMGHTILRMEDKLIHNAVERNTYESGIRVSYNLYLLTSDQKYMNIAYYFVEKSKSSILKEVIADLRAKEHGIIPDKLLAQEQHLRTNLAYYKTNLNDIELQKSEHDPAFYDMYKKSLLRTHMSLDSLLESFEDNYPKYYKLKYADNSPGLLEMQKNLENDEAIIEFFQGDSSMYVFCISSTSIHIESISIEFNQLVVNFLKTLEMGRNLDMGNDTRFVQYSSQLYKTCLKNTLENISDPIKKLTLIPDGILNYVPFDILLTEDSDTTYINYQVLPYLIRKYQIQYSHSSSLLNSNEQNFHIKNHKVLAMAPHYEETVHSDYESNIMQSRQEVSNLNWNRPEIEAIIDQIDGQIFTGISANEHNFKTLADSYSIIHLATHAIIDDSDPMNSRLLFSNNKSTNEDNILHAFELYNMRLNAQMAVLSACQTGYGPIRKGEGTMSLAHAFQYAGCPSVVMSLWSVNDKSTAELMQNFYQFLSEGNDKSAALRNAKLAYLEKADPLKLNPFYWSGFVVTGDTSPLVYRVKYQMYIVTIVGLTILLAIALYYHMKKKSI